MDISKAWGYGAVIFPRDFAWQGFIVLDPASKEMHPQVVRALTAAEQALGLDKREVRIAVEDYLSSCVAETLIEGNQAGLGVFAAALSEAIGARFWVVEAFMEPDGKSHTTIKLEATTPEAARDEINRRVEPLRQHTEMLAALKKLFS